MPRKNPVLLRRAPLSGRYMVLTNYRKLDGGGEKVMGDGKHDVTADFEGLLLQRLMDDGCEDVVPILECAAGLNDGVPYEKLTDAERAQLGELWRRMKALADAHNARADAVKAAA